MWFMSDLSKTNSNVKFVKKRVRGVIEAVTSLLVVAVFLFPSFASAATKQNGKILYTDNESGFLSSINPDGTDTKAISGQNPAGYAVLSKDGSKVAYSVTKPSIYTTDIHWSPDGSKVTFTANREGYGLRNLYVMDADGSNLHNLTDSTVSSQGIQSISWSSDGTKLLFNREIDNVNNIYLINADGSNLTKLPVGDDVSDPRWSPDNTKISYYKDGEIYVADPDGSDPINVSNMGGDPTAGQRGWSYDSSMLVFMVNGNDFYSVHADGTSKVKLNSDDSNTQDIYWSPTQNKILFDRHNTGLDRREIKVINSDGSGEATLATTLDHSMGPAYWSPNGNKITYVDYDDSDGLQDVYVMNANGSSKVNVSNSTENSNTPIWSPDSTKLSFSESYTGVLVVNADGSGKHSITSDPAIGPSSTVIWAPNSSSMLFSGSTPDSGDIHVWTVNEDGTGTANLTDLPHYHDNDGTWIANTDGTNQVKLSNQPTNGQYSWAPDNSMLAYRGNNGLNLVKADGTVVASDIGGNDAQVPEWTPDSSKLIFGQTSDNVVYSMNADGTNLTNLTPDDPDAAKYNPHLSADGTQIFYIRLDSNTNDSDLYRMNVDGTNKTNLTNTADFIESNIRVSSNGTRVAFTKYSTDYLEQYLMIMNSDGTGLVQVLGGASTYLGDITWSPDGSKLVLQVTSDIKTVNADGTGLTKVNGDFDDAYGPIWSPDSSKVLFVRGNNCYEGCGGGADENNDSIIKMYLASASGGSVNRVGSAQLLLQYRTWLPQDPSASGGRLANTGSSERAIEAVSFLLLGSGCLLLLKNRHKFSFKP
jgi:Tol biopolymer transport system component